ncbi:MULTISPECIES: response regulator transcription factor [Vibrio]|uniref:LuxR C-terminal-related transcriptional regulator n=1 Tax=Vibrio cortegadensis TaxID=1328770 RepID=A0ABV4M3T3_9VIBR|nr:MULTISPECIES: response regulator transcription factor [Vibrio]MDN3697138.1 response regulator transcription factor [Vibrio cortegadensis]
MEGKVLEKNKILLLSRTNIHSRLIQRELEKSNKFVIQQKTDKQFSQPYSVENISVILMSYHYIKDGLYTDLLSATTFDFNLVIYDVPVDLLCDTIVSWCCLKGILYEDAPVDHLTRCVEVVAKGDLWLPRNLMAQMLTRCRPYAPSTKNSIGELTKREQQILDRLVCGQSNLQIANELFVAESTVKTHIYKLYKKINVNCRKEAIRFARQQNQDNKKQQASSSGMPNQTTPPTLTLTS